jgi:predicted 2-oxoglutarate/Fe(II)-dependent dioxygenase YbiX
MEGVRIGCYDAAEQGYFRAHHDNTTPATEHRRFAITINLNTGDYQGGALRFPDYGPQLYVPPVGGAVVFSCSLLHEVLPVTAGRRFGLFTFFSTEADEQARLQKT